MDAFVWWCAALAIYLLAMIATAAVLELVLGPDPDLAERDDRRWDRP